MSFFTMLKDWFSSEFHALLVALQPGLTYLEKNASAEAIKLAEAVLTGAIAGTPWAALIAELLTQAEQSGVRVAEGAAGAILNAAQTNLIATGALPVAATTPPAA